MRSIAPTGGMKNPPASKPFVIMPSEVFCFLPSTRMSVYCGLKPRMEIRVLPIFVCEMSTPGTSPTAWPMSAMGLVMSSLFVMTVTLAGASVVSCA